MGLFRLLINTVNNLEHKQYLSRRSNSRCDERLKEFFHKFPGEVINGYIPLSCEHVGNVGYSRSGGHVEYYVRFQFADGSTRFEWFNNASDAKIFLNETDESSCVKIIGPGSIYGEFR